MVCDVEEWEEIAQYGGSETRLVYTLFRSNKDFGYAVQTSKTCKVSFSKKKSIYFPTYETAVKYIMSKVFIITK